MKRKTASHLIILCLLLCPLINIAQSGRTLDSLQLVSLYEATCENNSDCLLNWDFNQPIDTWEGITVIAERVTEIALGNRGLNGNIPDFSHLDSLIVLDISTNFLKGSIPGLASQIKLQEIDMGYNRLSGTIPNIDHLTELRELFLHRNRLTGEVPNFVLSNLIQFNLAFNELEGTVPEFTGIPNLRSLGLGFNDLTGEIPNLNHLTKLISLSLSSNQLTGNIPDLSGLQNLEYLQLDQNQLSDTIPDFNLPKLKEIGLGLNNFTGIIPNFSYAGNLESISLNNNKLEGTIPNFDIPTLSILSLNGNKLTGTIPEFNNTPNLILVALHDNDLSGAIPNISSNGSVLFFNIKNNEFSFDEIVSYLPNNNIFDFDYSPQRHDTIQSYIVKEGDSLRLSLSVPLPGNNNDNVIYQWKKNDEILVGANDSIYEINDLEISQLGKYTLHMTDISRVDDLEIISEPIYVYSKGYDLYGQPVVYNQVIMEFDTWEDKLFYEEKYLGPNTETQGFIADDCSCNRLLYLWDFPNDTLALQVLLNVNDNRTEAQTDDGEIDGGLNNIFSVSPILPGIGWTWSGNYPANYPDPVTIYLLDSGIDILHWDASNYLFDSAGVDACYDIAPSAGYDYTDATNSINGNFADSLGHGTFGVRSITEGLPSQMNIKIVPLKVFDQTGQGTLFNFICGLYHAIDHGADIINVSAGYAGEASEILKSAISLAHQKGIFIVTAAGNDGVDIDSLAQYPAYYSNDYYTIYEENAIGVLTPRPVYYDNVISVASINAQDTLSNFSSYGKDRVTMAAYGENMSGYSHLGESVSSSGSSVATYYVTRELAVEMTKNKNRDIDSIWQDFEELRMRNCPTITEFTKTGKCLDINLNEIYGDFQVFIEGAYDSLKMRTTLNTSRFLLPGQSASDSIVTHPALHPYNISPFEYEGDEAVPGYLTNYPPYVVDWVLVSLRADIAKETEISRTAAWLTNTGKIQLLKPLFEDKNISYDSAYVVVEHRNHLGIMSPEKISLQNSNIITWNFTQQNSYINIAGSGQIELAPGIWAMIAGDGNQVNDTGGYDINGDDKLIWKNYEGNFNQYLPADYNMDGDVNGADKIYWLSNNGKFSDVPR